MRKYFAKYIEDLSGSDDLVFITGDLGYGALEGVAKKFGNRFINAGVAEQNMVGMAAGMAYKGYRVICYSIAPFIVYRCLEQMRNDVCFHNLPVFLVGNGGGYGYGIMGSSHHTLDDISCLSNLPNITCYVPAYHEDLDKSMNLMLSGNRPAYLRLGLGKPTPAGLELTESGVALKNSSAKLTVVTLGPIVNNVVDALNKNFHKDEIELFIVNKMPLRRLPDDIRSSIIKSKNVLTVEEHMRAGGLGSSLSLLVNEQGLQVERFKSLNALGYPNDLFGSQSYHQNISGLNAPNISDQIDFFFR